MEIKQGNAVKLRYNLKWSDGTDVDIRKQTGLTFVLTLPDDTTISITDCGYDALNNQVWVAIDGSHTATAGTYKGNLSVITTDLQMVTTGIITLFTASADGTDQESVLALAVTAVETPINDGQGYSPKIVNSEWYVYDDAKKAYVATGQTIGVTQGQFTELQESFTETFNENETARDAKVDAKVADITELQSDIKNVNGSYETSGGEFEIADENGYVIANFQGGDVKTKNFDSSKIIKCVNDNSNANFNIGDESGNVIMQLSEGHIKTKNFDSSNIITDNIQPRSYRAVPFSFNCQQLIQHGNAGSASYPSPYDVKTNSWKLFRWAVKNGFKIIETDIRATSDGVFVLCHNETINEAATNADGTAISGNVYVANSTYEELCQYKFGGEQIVTLEEFLRFCKRYNIGCHFDEKVNLSTTSDFFDIIKKCGMLGNVYIEPNISGIKAFSAYDTDRLLKYQLSDVATSNIASTYNTYKDYVDKLIFNITNLSYLTTDYSDACHNVGCLAKVNLQSDMTLQNVKYAMQRNFDLVLSNYWLPSEAEEL